MKAMDDALARRPVPAMSPHYCWRAELRRLSSPCAAQCRYCCDTQAEGVKPLVHWRREDADDADNGVRRFHSELVPPYNPTPNPAARRRR